MNKNKIKKSIVIITPEYSGNRLFDGGLASFLDKFINLICHKYNVHLIISSNHNRSTKKKKFVLHEVKINFFLKLIKFTKINILIYLLYYPLQSLLLNNFLKKMIPKPDIHFYTNFEYVSLFQPKNIKSIVRISSFDHVWFKIGLFSKKISKIYDNIVLRKSYQIWSTSEFVSKYINKEHKKKISQTPPFLIPNRKFKLSKSLNKFKKEKFILFIGTISRRKGIHLLSDLFANIYKINKNIRFIIIGRDTNDFFRSNFQFYFQNKLFSKNCIYFGVKKKNFFFPLIKYAKIAVVPSLIETSPNILQEILMNDGIPLCSKNTSMEELLLNNHNFLFENNDSKDLFNKSIKLMSKKNYQLRKKINFFKKLLFEKKRKQILFESLNSMVKK